MKISDLKLSKSAVGILKSQGYSELYPPQEQSIKAGLLDGKNILVSAPTASGKTLIAILAMINFLSKNQGKIVYLSPLRALASEKFSEFKITLRAMTVTHVFCTPTFFVGFMGNKIIQCYFFMLANIHYINIDQSTI